MSSFGIRHARRGSADWSCISASRRTLAFWVLVSGVVSEAADRGQAIGGWFCGDGCSGFSLTAVRMKFRTVFTAIYSIDCAFIWCLTVDAAEGKSVNREAGKNEIKYKEGV